MQKRKDFFWISHLQNAYVRQVDMIPVKKPAKSAIIPGKNYYYCCYFYSKVLINQRTIIVAVRKMIKIFVKNVMEANLESLPKNPVLLNVNARRDESKAE